MGISRSVKRRVDPLVSVIPTQGSKKRTRVHTPPNPLLSPLSSHLRRRPNPQLQQPHGPHHLLQHRPIPPRPVRIRRHPQGSPGGISFQGAGDAVVEGEGGGGGGVFVVGGEGLQGGDGGLEGGAEGLVGGGGAGGAFGAGGGGGGGGGEGVCVLVCGVVQLGGGGG